MQSNQVPEWYTKLYAGRELDQAMEKEGVSLEDRIRVIDLSFISLNYVRHLYGSGARDINVAEFESSPLDHVNRVRTEIRQLKEKYPNSIVVKINSEKTEENCITAENLYKRRRQN